MTENTTEKCLALSCGHPPFKYFLHADEICPKPSPLQVKLSQLPQPFLIGEVLQSLNHPCGLLWDSFQYAHVSLLLGSPELDQPLKMWPHWC